MSSYSSSPPNKIPTSPGMAPVELLFYCACLAVTVESES